MFRRGRIVWHASSKTLDAAQGLLKQRLHVPIVEPIEHPATVARAHNYAEISQDP